MALFLLFGLICSTAAAIYVFFFVGRRENHLPPGPPTLPILGNIHQIPKKSAHFQFSEWAKQYGGLYSLKLGTGTAVVITDRRLVKQLIDKKSALYSDRPKSYVANLISSGDHILLMAHGQQWRSTRKLLHGSLMEKAVDEQHLPLQEAEARQMLRDYLLKPEDHMLHPKRFSNSVTMSIVWGIRTPTSQTEHMESLYSLMEIWSQVMETGATPPVDVYPILHNLPQKVFLHWRDRATHVQRSMNALYASFLTGIRARRQASGSRGSLMDKVLDQVESEKAAAGMTYSDHELWFLGGTVTEGGSDTSASIITAFVQAMVAYPNVQRKAQAEIDRVVGEDRSPTWEDYAALPYVAQCVKEAMRWRPVTPLAFPHALAQDDWVDGYLIPKGTTVIINAWGMQHDAARYKNPEAFDPDHFAGCTKLAPELANGAYEDRDHYGYGAGRRLCPGIHLAERNLFLAMSKLLWAFDMSPSVDESGRDVPVDTDPRTAYSEGFLVCAKDFPARFRIRSQDKKETVLREFGEVESAFAKYEA
ncbi:hypothetical protein MBLNU13_g02377t1 [Cladosporium sp. NU13]